MTIHDVDYENQTDGDSSSNRLVSRVLKPHVVKLSSGVAGRSRDADSYSSRPELLSDELRYSTLNASVTIIRMHRATLARAQTCLPGTLVQKICLICVGRTMSRYNESSYLALSAGIF